MANLQRQQQWAGGIWRNHSARAKGIHRRRQVVLLASLESGAGLTGDTIHVGGEPFLVVVEQPITTYHFATGAPLRYVAVLVAPVKNPSEEKCIPKTKMAADEAATQVLRNRSSR